GGSFDAIILAAAGLRRLGFGDRIRCSLPSSGFIPAIAQGALGIEYQTARTDIAEWLAPFENQNTTSLVGAERAFGRALTASCDIPLGATATLIGNTLSIDGFVAMPDGSRMIRRAMTGAVADAQSLGTALAQMLIDEGAGEILASLSRHGGDAS
ncbi:MAG: hydroxymethylbilane synthase, partial [Aeromicrobium sp.]|nr:hydroxymethylbilane synthase [Burkholderiales bacterium]